MPFFCISSRSWNAINLKRLRKETWKIHRTRGRRWKHSSAVRELQADDWQLPLPTRAELFRSRWSLRGVGDRVLPVASTLQHLRFPQCYKQHSLGRAGSTARTPVPRCCGTDPAQTGRAAQGWGGTGRALSWLWSMSCCMAALRPNLKCSG